MKYDYVVNHNGRIYEIGEEVPDTSSPVSVTETKEAVIKDEAKVEVTKNKGGRPRKAQ